MELSNVSRERILLIMTSRRIPCVELEINGKLFSSFVTFDERNTAAYVPYAYVPKTISIYDDFGSD